MIRPLRRWHRRMIAAAFITLAAAALLAVLSRPPDARMDVVPAALAPRLSPERVP